MTPEIWFNLVKSFGFLIVTLVGGYYALKWSVRETAAKLVAHAESDEKLFEGILEKLTSINGGVQDMSKALNDHSIALARHDERTSNTAEILTQAVRKIDTIDEKVNSLRERLPR